MGIPKLRLKISVQDYLEGEEPKKVKSIILPMRV